LATVGYFIENSADSTPLLQIKDFLFLKMQ